ncbi:hypothetical protein AB0I61_32825 [Polymorphospora rubra]|uniref:hypothetical protein n=1 Tax=Polymorphospora rubra TaxID=338584 RepID=UPI00340EBC60
MTAKQLRWMQWAVRATLTRTRMTPREVTGLSRWSSHEVAAYLAWHEDIRVAYKLIAE